MARTLHASMQQTAAIRPGQGADLPLAERDHVEPSRHAHVLREREQVCRWVRARREHKHDRRQRIRIVVRSLPPPRIAVHTHAHARTHAALGRLCLQVEWRRLHELDAHLVLDKVDHAEHGLFRPHHAQHEHLLERRRRVERVWQRRAVRFLR
jgi:hypothetical protein